MEIVKSRYGVDRSIERINLNLVRVMGESQFIIPNEPAQQFNDSNLINCSILYYLE